MESFMESALKGHLLLTLVDHAKLFKGTWRIYRQGETIYSACHSAAPSGAGPTAEAFCQSFNSNRQVSTHCFSLPASTSVLWREWFPFLRSFPLCPWPPF
jgi:hypothetical protein